MIHLEVNKKLIHSTSKTRHPEVQTENNVAAFHARSTSLAATVFSRISSIMGSVVSLLFFIFMFIEMFGKNFGYDKSVSAIEASTDFCLSFVIMLIISHFISFFLFVVLYYRSSYGVGAGVFAMVTFTIEISNIICYPSFGDGNELNVGGIAFVILMAFLIMFLFASSALSFAAFAMGRR